MKKKRITALLVVIVAAVSTFSTSTTIILQSSYAVSWTDPNPNPRGTKEPAVISGENVYIVWWNGTAGEPDVQTDIMFRASTDGGATFADKINLSNTTEADSWNVEIAGEGDTVVVSWWETNQTSDIPVARISNDGGETFGPMLTLAANGTISGSTEEEGGEGAAEGEEGGGGEGED